MPAESRSPRSRVLFELGRGGMGTVFLAVSEGPGGFRKLKVVKQLRPELAEDPELVAMLLDEARTAARIDHDNVVKTYEVGFDGTGFAIEMEYLEGLSLARVMRDLERRGEVMPRAIAVWIVAQVLAGLHHAHALADPATGAPLHIVHRDVSPHNVMLTYGGGVKLLDFGIAKAADSLAETRTGDVKGKTRYMAPEQAARGAIDRRTDVFAVGIVLHELGTGRRFWGELGEAEILARLAAGELPRAPELAPIPEALAAVLARALAPSPDARYATAAEMEAELEEVLATEASRVGSRHVSAMLAARFEAERTAMKRRIEEALTGREREPPSASAPGDGDPTAPVDAPPSGEERSRTKSGFATGAGRASAARARGRRVVALSAVLVAGVSLAAWGAVRVARSGGAPAAAPSPSVAAPPGCTRAADCAPSSSGAHAVCRADVHRCATLESAACRVVAEDAALADPRTFWVGSMFPLSAPGADQNAKVYERGVLLAREDFAKVTHGVPPKDGVGAPRPIGLVACDSTRDPSGAARHLVDDLGVRAVLGFSGSDTLISLAGSLFIPSDVLALSVSDGSAYVSSIPHPPGGPRLVWRTTMDTWGMAKPAARLVSQLLEPELRARGAATIRVALVREDSIVGLSSADAITSMLVMNGEPALQNGDAFADVVVRRDDLASHAAAVERLLALAPHVVLYTARDEEIPTVLAPLEARWPRSARHRPIYVEDTTLGGRALDALFAARPDVRARTFGMYGPLKTSQNLRFTQRYAEGADAPLPYTMVPGSAYDAFYVLAYALFVAQDEPPSGAALARAIGRLMPPGEPVEVGPGKIFRALDVLRGGGNVDLEGTATNLDFDPRTGDAMGDVVLDCARAKGAGFEAEEIPVTYAAATQRWSGKVVCPF